MGEPFTKKSDKNMALMNEFFCLLVNYHLLIFTDWVPDGPARETMGKSLISVTLLNILINFSYISINSISGLSRVAKLHWKRYKVLKTYRLKLKKAAIDNQDSIVNLTK